MAQVLLCLDDGNWNLKHLISEPFESEGQTVPQLKYEIREAIEELLRRAIHLEGISMPKPIRGRNYVRGISELLHVIDNDYSVTFYLSKGEGYVTPIKLDELEEEQITLPQILENFDRWAANLRSRIEDMHSRGQLPVGSTFEMAEEDIPYYTKFEMGLPKDLEQNLTHTPEKDIYEGLL